MSWENVAKWYDKSVGEKGQYYQEHLIIPHLIRLFKTKEKLNILDLGCGQAVLSRALPKEAHYLGIDVSASLIQSAKKRAENQKNAHFLVKDLTKPLDLPQKDFTHAIFLLSLQNMKDGLIAIKNAFAHLKKRGQTIYHPQSSLFSHPQTIKLGHRPSEKTPLSSFR